MALGLTLYAREFPQKGDPFPNIALPLIENGENKMIHNYLGNFLVIDFWATWCRPCAKSLPELQMLQDSISSIQVVGINLDENHTSAKKFIKQYQIKFDNLHDVEKKLSKTLDIQGMPTLFIVDRKGIILKRIDGYSEKNLKEIKSFLTKLIEEKK